ncbi:phytanoyl-CoA dioxygenase family protein [Pseudoalteromonas fenneropenaei]|uniref:Phytanoyl-CoA dioxygenase family protein n=1 Tax=Pseudoalteromonas fenneropenaei TaxID=1737459 RepID=A0ABV7CDK4_9GAMM
MHAQLPSSLELSPLGIPHLKRFWYSSVAAPQSAASREDEHELDRMLFDLLGVGLHQVLNFVYAERPSFSELEHWMVTKVGQPCAHTLARLQAIYQQKPYSGELKAWLHEIEQIPDVLSQEDLAHWQEHGYVIVKNAVSLAAAKEAEQALWQYLKAEPEQPDTWYSLHNRSGIMVELIQHPAFAANRHAARIHKAFAQLWQTADLRVSADRGGFNPPERQGFEFSGPDLHWDINFNKPLQFGTQGILYLTDTAAEQGAFTLVPGFQHHLPTWLAELPPAADPQQQDLHALGAKAIAANAGDLIIWHQWLPHGSRPNTTSQPRMVQYINYLPVRI